MHSAHEGKVKVFLQHVTGQDYNILPVKSLETHSPSMFLYYFFFFQPNRGSGAQQWQLGGA